MAQTPIRTVAQAIAEAEKQKTNDAADTKESETAETKTGKTNKRVKK